MNTKRRYILAVAACACLLLAMAFLSRGSVGEAQRMDYNKLTPQEEAVIVHKGTERAFTGKYDDHYAAGIYTCKRCDAKLYGSDDKFKSSCGWPSFDDFAPGAVRERLDADGQRTEILCRNCGAHLGHVFRGEGYTPEDTRHCVNSISMNFVPAAELMEKKDGAKEEARAFFAGGCFWGVEHLLGQQAGVVSTSVGYMGGRTKRPTYEEVCAKDSGHAEAVEVVFNEKLVSYETLAKLFFEIHDPAQLNRQGPDLGEQYRSAVFYADEEQRRTAHKLIEILRSKGMNVVTQVEPAQKFWPAEDYHQDYNKRTGKQPYCHVRTPRF